ncbi:leucine Rich repeat family protein [Bifidobacterium dolichotidis]|uniref:Leucine Rich repeat family protein n=1 Tax=Bifidobacterium dolichotidis TaxID=2306976 RepID=A0A430FTB5_9BIFI|nr:hypothetical protein [Bifidobacterium dolichotidis]RSX56055.1 leucine Rich repeat family protein [Bifidobacterium dolichotidis]
MGKTRQRVVAALAILMTMVLPYVLGTSIAVADEEAIPLDEQHFPDIQLRWYLEFRLQKEENDVITREERYSLDEISVPWFWTEPYRTTTLQGIEYFPNLKRLTAESGNMTTVDISKNPELESLTIHECNLEFIDISHNPKLEYVDVSRNKLNAIDTSKNAELKVLDVSYNGIATIDMSKNSKLQGLEAFYNKLTDIDVTKNPELKSLGVGVNNLATLDVSKNLKLRTLIAPCNKLTFLDLPQPSSVWTHDPSNSHLSEYNNPLLGININAVPHTLEIDSDDDSARTYTVPASERSLNLTEIAPQLDLTKISNIQGGTLNGSELTPDTYPGTVTYHYLLHDQTFYTAKIQFTEQGLA